MNELDPDAFAELKREQSFLLRSLDDLDAERAAGDLDEDDHAQLGDDYTRRLAEVTRALDDRRAAFASNDNRLSGRQRIVTVAGVVIVAVLAGILLARASGFRSPTDTLSGDIRQSSTGLLAEADVLTREGRWEEAIEVYDEVLDISAANTEALTYRGWLTSRLGEGTGLADLDEAIAIDPSYPDARVFRAIVLDDEQRFADAAADLAVLDGLEADDQILGLVGQSGLRASVAAGQIVQLFGESGEPIDLDQVVAPVADVAEGGVVLLQVGDVGLALRVFDAVIEREPDNLLALLASGEIQTRPEVVELSTDTGLQGLERLDAAVAAAPGNAQTLLIRARARFDLGDPDGSRADLQALDSSQLREEELVLYESLLVALDE